MIGSARQIRSVDGRHAQVGRTASRKKVLSSAFPGVCGWESDSCRDELENDDDEDDDDDYNNDHEEDDHNEEDDHDEDEVKLPAADHAAGATADDHDDDDSDDTDDDHDDDDDSDDSDRQYNDGLGGALDRTAPLL
jgi:hypothetical protein